MGSAKPTILLVPGAWHKPEHFDSLAAALEVHGYSVARVRLPSVLYTSDEQAPTDPQEADTAAIRSATDAILSSRNDIVVFAHSYGGIPASEAVYGLGKSSLGAGHGVVHMVFCASYIPKEGSCLVEVAGESVEERPAWNAFTSDNTKCYVKPGQEIETFFADCEPEVAQRAKSLLAPYQSVMNWFVAQTVCAWRDVPSTYIHCKNDAAIKPVVQERMIKEAGVFGTEGEGRLYALDSGHCPFLSRTEEVVTIVRRAAGERI